MTLKLLLWDSDEIVPAEFSDFLIVNLAPSPRNRTQNSISIIEYIELNDKCVKEELLGFVFEITNNHCLKKIFESDRDFYMWQMSDLNLKFNSDPDSPILATLKIIAVDHLINKMKPRTIIVKSNSRGLRHALKGLAQGLKFTSKLWFYQPKRERKINNILFLIIKSHLWLVRHLLLFRKAFGLGVDKWQKSNSTVLFSNYLFNTPSSAVKNHVYESRFWGALIRNIEENGQQVNWVHNWNKSSTLETVTDAANYLNKLNYNYRDAHVFVESFITFRLVLKSYLHWFRYMKFFSSVKSEISWNFKGKYDLYKIWEGSVKKFFFSPSALKNHLNNELYSSAFEKSPNLTKIFYLHENQSWEYALLNAARSAEKMTVYANLHSTVRYWDLRYFFDSRHFTDKKLNYRLLPDFYLVNNRHSKLLLVESGVPNEMLINVGPLRYEMMPSNWIPLEERVSKSTILLLTGAMYDITIAFLGLMDDFSKKNPWFRFIIKLHPSCGVEINVFKYLATRSSLVSSDISVLVDGCRCAIVDSITSASVDLLKLAVPVVTVVNFGDLNMSPVRGFDDSIFAYNVDDVEKFCLGDNFALSKGEYFFAQKECFSLVDLI